MLKIKKIENTSDYKNILELRGNIHYWNQKTGYSNVNMGYADIVKLHGIKTKEDKIESVYFTKKNIVYVFDKRGNILETFKEV